jgi:hypothetical protein
VSLLPLRQFLLLALPLKSLIRMHLPLLGLGRRNGFPYLALMRTRRSPGRFRWERGYLSMVMGLQRCSGVAVGLTSGRSRRLGVCQLLQAVAVLRHRICPPRHM